MSGKLGQAQIEFLIGERTYRSKESAKAAIYDVRDRVTARGKPTPEDDDFLRDLVALHPDAEAKVGCGIDYFEVRRNVNNEDFWIVRTDNSETDFSFIKCLYGASQVAKLQSAMRYAILDQKLAARDALDAHRARQNNNKDHGTGPDDFVFTAQSGQPVGVKNLYHHSFVPLMQRAGVPRISFHALRHTNASLALANGVNMRVLQEQLGHRDVGVLLRRYATLTLFRALREKPRARLAQFSGSQL